MSTTGIKQVAIEGLHEQFDVRLSLNPGLNIIYGKNGRGKTTLLHVLANALELDFKRFEHLNFRRISISTYGGTSLEIVKQDSNDKPRVFIDGASTSLFNDAVNLSDVEVATFRQAFGDRPTYLAAFRSVLERIRYDASSPYQRDHTRDLGGAEIEEQEFHALREAVAAERSRREGMVDSPRALREEAASTSRKTVQCRQWFGQFVPVVRYPSIHEVDDGLTSEWQFAQIEMARREQNMFADVFVKVFRTIVGLEDTETALPTDELLKQLADSLHSNEHQIGDRGLAAIYDQLLEAAEFFTRKSDRDANGLEMSVLHLYLKTFTARKAERTLAFQKSREFEDAINKFLDKKKLRIGSSESRARPRSWVTVGTEGGRTYGLSSLSSGEKQILTMLYSASRSRFKTGLFLIDEPELSLHVDWQRQILQELMSQAPDRQIIACTHSPEVGADHFLETQDFEPTLSTQGPQDGLFVDEEPEE